MSAREIQKLRRALNQALDLAEEANGDPSWCSHSTLIADEITELRLRHKLRRRNA